MRNYIFREAGDVDFEAIERLFEGAGVEPGWAVWKYSQSPDGRARIFVAEGPDRSIVGTLVYMPRSFSIPGSDSLTVMQAVDIYLRPELRDQQVFLGILGLARQHVFGPRIGVPNELSVVFASGPNWRVLGLYERCCFPVVIGKNFTGKLFGLISALLNGLSRIYQLCWLGGSIHAMSMQRIARFKKDFPPDPVLIQGVRSAAYLNWRFVDNPFVKYQVYEFIDGEESVGYCVFTQVESSLKSEGERSDTLVLSDFMAKRRRRQCMRILIEYCRERDIALIVYNGLGLQLGKLGFIRRGECKQCVASNLPEGRWAANTCDIDAEPGRAITQAN